jgi:hypothetical protein
MIPFHAPSGMMVCSDCGDAVAYWENRIGAAVPTPCLGATALLAASSSRYHRCCTGSWRVEPLLSRCT